jgi:methylaspartate mutase sigma subunit
LTKTYKVVLGVIGNDIHVVALRLLDIALREAGIATSNIGVNRFLDDFLDEAERFGADAILMSSNNGEAALWCGNIRAEAKRRGMGHLLLYIGGTLEIGIGSDEAVERKFLAMGFDRVYSRRGLPGEVAEQVLADLAARVNAK